MDILYILRPEIEKLPPCLSQIYALKKEGHNVRFLSMHISDNIKNIFNSLNVEYAELKNLKDDSNVLGKIINIINFGQLIKQEIKNHPNSKLWVGAVDSAVHYKNIILKSKCYVLNIFELYDQFPKILKRIKPVAQNAKAVIVPEHNRAHILKVWLDLKKLPIVIPNKPFYQETEIDNKTKEIVSKLKKINKKIILYQGWISAERDIYQIAKALQNEKIKNEFAFVIMGPLENKNSLKEIEKVNSDIIYIPFVTPPQHLFVTELADIGIATYDDSSLNTIFCAPNKIYEYAMKKVPVLARDIPGLESTVGKYKIGKCVDRNSEKSIIEGIKEISQNYGSYERAFDNFLSDCDVQKKISNVIEQILNSEK